jgi:hypothetical protein
MWTTSLTRGTSRHGVLSTDTKTLRSMSDQAYHRKYGLAKRHLDGKLLPRAIRQKKANRN